MIPRELFRKIRRIEIRTKGLVENVFGGEYHSAFRGRGIAFSEVRPYQIGDDIRSIDWNVSARAGETYVKVFEEEREQTLMLLVDVSGSGAFGSRDRMKRELAAEICATIAFSAIKNQDKVGMVLFTDRVELFVPPRKGRRHVLRLIRDLYAFQPVGVRTNLDGALAHLMHVLKRRSIVLILSDFLDSGYERTLRIVAARHDAVAVHLHDPREVELPPAGLLDLQDAETGEHITIDTTRRAARRFYAETARARLSGVEAILRRARVDVVSIGTDDNFVEQLVRFFRQRNRERR